jgi:hypothetical protein
MFTFTRKYGISYFSKPCAEMSSIINECFKYLSINESGHDYFSTLGYLWHRIVKHSDDWPVALKGIGHNNHG